MRKWPKQHVRIFMALVFLLLFLGVTYAIFVRPLAVKVRSDRAYIENTKNELGRTGWPLDPGRLESFVQLKKTELEGGKLEGSKKDIQGMKQKSQQMLRQCTGMLNSKVRKVFENHSDFLHNLTRLDFQQEFNDLEIKLASKNIFITESMLGLGENTQTQNIYQLILQVWIIDKITALAMESGLSVQADDKVIAQDERGRKRPAAKIQMMPIVEYRLYEEDKTPYVMVLPVRLALYGNIGGLWNFFRKLQSPEHFFAVSQVQMSMLPDIRNDDVQLSLEAKNIKVEIECNAFYYPSNESSGDVPRKPAPPKILPGGS